MNVSTFGVGFGSFTTNTELICVPIWRKAARRGKNFGKIVESTRNAFLGRSFRISFYSTFLILFVGKSSSFGLGKSRTFI